MAREQTSGEPNEPVVLKRGTFNRVRLETRATKEDPNADKKSGSGIRRILGAVKLFQGQEAKNRMGFSVIGGLIMEKGSWETIYEDLIPKGHSDRDKMMRAKVIAVLAMSYVTLKDFPQFKDKPYQLGLYLSDFFELLPTELASQILVDASDPRYQEELVAGYDQAYHAAQALILLPREKREEIFIQMGEISPNKDGRAYQLYSRLTTSMYDNHSELQASRIIEGNFGDRPDQIPTKVEEFREHMADLGEKLRANWKSDTGTIKQPRRI